MGTQFTVYDAGKSFKKHPDEKHRRRDMVAVFYVRTRIRSAPMCPRAILNVLYVVVR